ncbi:MAG: tetratricopeptide repeat protein [Pyrinomonadaceae bacterium]|nr:tetratricopeptide repeat protein [Pyrinomonadaceae bacterium]
MKLINLTIISLTIILSVVFAPAQEGDIAQDITAAQNLLKNGDASGAINILQTSLQKSPNNEKLKYEIGRVYYSQGNYPRAIESLSVSYNKLPESAPEYRLAVRMLGLSHYVLGHLSDAIPFLEKVTVWEPNNNEFGYALGVSYIQTRQPEKSRQSFAKLFGVQTNSASAYLLNAQMLIRQQFEETAEIELNKALELDPKLPQVRFLLGEMAIYKADIEKGVGLLKEEIALNPANAMAYYRLGEALTRQLKWDEAIAPSQKSIWLNPFFSGPYIVLGKVYFKKQDLGNAQNLLQRAVAIDPKNFGAHYLLGQVLQQAGKTEEAKAEFTLAEQLRGKNEQNP